MQKFLKYGLGLGCVLAAGAASAAVDTTSAVAEFQSVGTAVGTIGGAMLTAVAAGIAIKWVVAYLL